MQVLEIRWDEGDVQMENGQAQSVGAQVDEGCLWV